MFKTLHHTWHTYITERSCPADITYAPERARGVDARASIGALHLHALVKVKGTVGAGPALGAQTRVGALSVEARGPVLTRPLQAFVHI